MLALISFFLNIFVNGFSEQRYIRIYWADFHAFSPNGRYLFVDDRSGPFFPISQGILPWQSIFGEVCEMTFIQQAGVAKQIGTLQFRF